MIISLVSGREVPFVLLIFVLTVVTFSILRAMKGKIPTIRELPAMAAIKEAVGRCVEMGTPILYAGGNSLAGLASPRGPGHMAGLGILGEVASQAARLKAETIALVSWPEQLPIADAIVRNAYDGQGYSEGYKPDDVEFTSDRSFTHCIRMMSLVYNRKPASCVLAGSYSGESLLMCETASSTGAIVIGGTETANQMPYFAAVCDYLLIGPEIFAAEAAATGQPVLLGSLLGDDIVKAVSICLLFAGLALTIIFGVKIG